MALSGASDLCPVAEMRCSRGARRGMIVVTHCLVRLINVMPIPGRIPSEDLTFLVGKGKEWAEFISGGVWDLGTFGATLGVWRRGDVGHI